MKNRLIGLWLVLTMLVSLGTVLAAEEEMFTVDQEMTILNMLNLVPDCMSAPDDSEITKEEFAQMLVYLMGCGEVLPNLANETVPLVDCLGNTEGMKAVRFLYQLGIISGDGQGRCYPKSGLDRNQVLKMLLGVMGYDGMAKNNGGYPDGYLKAAAQADLLSSCSLSEKVTKKEAVRLVYHALDKNILQKVHFYNNGYVVSEIQNGTILSEYLKVGVQKGIVTANQDTALAGGENTAENVIRVDDTEFILTSQTSYARELLGYRVRLYYDLDEEDNNRLLYIEKYQTDELYLHARDIKAYKNNTYTYYNESGTQRRAKVLQTGSVIYNGVFCSSYTDEMAVPHIGGVRLIDADHDSFYETVFIENYKNFVVSYVDSAGAKVYNRYVPDKIFDFSDSAVEYELVSETGYPMSFENIKQDQVLSVGESVDGKKVRIVICQSVIEGTIERVSAQKERTLVSIDTEEYELAWQFAQSIPTGGMKGQFFLDCGGDIAYYKSETDNAGIRFGYVIYLYFNDDTQTYNMKLMDDKGNKNSYEFADKVTVNQATVSSASIGERSELFHGDGSGIKQLVRYELDAQGQIKKIETAATQAETGKVRLYQTAKGSFKYRSSTATLGFQTFVNQNTQVFVVPETDSPSYTGNLTMGANAKEYYVTGNGAFANDKNYNIIAYNTQEDATVAEAVLLYTNVEIPSILSVYTPLSVVDEITAVVDEENEVRTQISGLRQGTQFELKIKNEDVMENVLIYDRTQNKMVHQPMQISKGDVIRYNTDSWEDIDLIQLIYDESERKFYGDNRMPTQFSADAGLNYGYLIRRSSNSSEHAYFSSIDYGTGERKNTVSAVLPIGKFNISVYDATGRTPVIRPGTYLDITDEKSVGSGSSEIVYMTRLGDPTYMIVYNR